MSLIKKFEDNTTNLKINPRGGGIEIDLEPWGYPEGSRMSAYQNYLGGGMLGRIAGDCNISKDWMEDDILAALNESLKKYFADLIGADFKELESMPVSAY